MPDHIDQRLESLREEYPDVKWPTVREKCERCDGHGKHVNPSIDGHGISMQEFDEDPEFRQAYFSGRYDVRCEECDGEKIVEYLDWENLKGEALQIAQAFYDGERAYERECRMERLLGA
jgi:hypothetical protein